MPKPWRFVPSLGEVRQAGSQGTWHRILDSKIRDKCATQSQGYLPGKQAPHLPRSLHVELVRGRQDLPHLFPRCLPVPLPPPSAVPSHRGSEDQIQSVEGRAEQILCLVPSLACLGQQPHLYHGGKHSALPASQTSRSKQVTPGKVPQASRIRRGTRASNSIPCAAPNPCGTSLTKPGIWQESRKAAASFSSCFWSRTSSWQDSGKRTPVGGTAEA